MVRTRNHAFGLAARLLTGLVAGVLLLAALPARAQTIGFAFGTTSVSEGGTNAVLVVSRSPANGAASVLFSTVDGNAAGGTDFIATNGVLSFVNGEASKLISIGILSDTLPEPPKSFFVILSDPIGGVLGISTNVVTILDDDSLYSFSTFAYRVDEGASNLVVTVIRGGGTFGAGTVEVTTSDGTNASPALSGVNYVATRAIVSFTNGQSSATVNIPIIDNLLTETNLSFFVALGNPVSGSVATPASATATITDNDPAGGTLEFIYPPPIPVIEGFGTTIAVTRRGGSVGAVSVDYRQINRGNAVTNATPLIDYTGDSGTLTWADGDSTPKFITLTMLNDANVELDETAVIGLFGSTNAAINLSRSTMPVIILSSDQAPGSAERGYNAGVGANNTVYALAVNNLPGDPNNGRTVIAGDFTAVNGVPITRIARVNANGSVDTNFNAGTGPDGYVAAVAIQPNAAVVLGGGFTSVNGTNWNGIGRLLPNGALDPSFRPGDGANGPVNVLALQPDGKILIGGEFTAIDHVARNRLARLNVDGSLDSTFNPGAGANATVHALDLQADGKILVGGRFTSFNNGTLPYLVRLNPDGSTDATFAPLSGPDAPVFTVLAQASGAIYAGGNFRTFDGLDRSGVVRLATNGLVDATFNPGTGVNGAVYTMRVEPGGLPLLAGDFTVFNGTVRTNLARLNVDGTLDTSFMDLYYNQTAPGPNGFVLALDLEAGGNLMIGGGFTAIGGGNSPQDVRPRLYFGRVVGGPIAPPLNNPGNVEFFQAGYTVDENDSRTFITIQARRLHGNLGPFIADYVTVDGTAVSGRDYIGGQGTVNWADGDPLTQLVTIQISLINNAVIDGNRTFSVVLSNPRNLSPRPTTQPALGFTTTTEITIVDDDFNRGVLAFSSAVYEVLEGAGTATITVVRTNGSAGAVSVQYTTANGSASATVGPVQGDYTTTAGTLTFVSGQTNASFTVRLTDDTVVEFDETVNLRLFNVSGGATLGRSNATLVIFDNENPALNPGSLSFASATYTVGEGATNALVTVRRTSGAAGVVTVDALTADFPAGPGFARAGSDYAATTNRLVFGAGVTSQSFVVAVYQDPFVEGDEVLGLQLVNPLGGARLGLLTNASLTIVEDDFYGAISFSAANYSVNEIAGSVAISVTRTGGSSQPVSVDFATAPLTAIPGTDYLDVISTLNFADGETNKVVTIPVLNNDLVQNNKTVALTLSNLLKATPGRFMQATLTIFDDESLAAPAGTVDPSFVPVPGFNGPVNALALHRNNALLVGGGFSTFNGQAVGPLVRLTLSGLLDPTFASRVGTDGDVRALAVQNDGRIVVGGGFLNFNGVSRRSITRLNDDGTTDTTFAPGAGGDNPVFAVAVRADGRIVVGGSFVTFNGVSRPNVALLNADGSVDASFNTGVGPNGPVYALGVQVDGKVVIAGDFTTVNNVARARVARLNANGTLDLTFDPGTGPDSGVRALLVLRDRRIAVGGSFGNVAGAARSGIALLTTNGVVDAAFNPGTGTDAVVLGLAQDANGRLLAVGNFTEYQGLTRRGVVRINLDGGVDSSINFGAGADNFVAAVVTQPDQQIVVGGGFTQFDGRPRGGIARVLGGENPGGGEFELASTSYSVSEAGGLAVIDVRRRGGLFGPASVNYTIAPGTGVAGVDYVAANGTLTFPAGEALGSFTLQILNNTSIADGDRTVLLALNTNAPASGAGLGAVRAAVLTILNDDQSVGFVTANYSVNENTISGRASILVQRTGGTSDFLFVDYATTTTGTATPGLDFVPTSGTLVFNPGETAVAFSVAIINDSLVESDETVGLLLSNARVPANSTATIALGLSSATLTIIDNEFGPGSFQFATNSFIVSEGVGSAAVVIQRVNGSGGIATVRFATSNGTAINGLDYIATNGVLTFAAGEISKTVLVRVINDAFLDGDETVNLTLSAATGAGIIRSNAVLTILDDDSLVSFSASTYSVDEAGPTVPVTILRTGSTNVTVRISLSTTDGTALAGSDYVALATNVEFVPGVTNLTVRIPIISNPNITGNRAFFVSLTNGVSVPSGSVLFGQTTAMVTIRDLIAGGVDTNFVHGFGADGPIHTILSLTNSVYQLNGAATNWQFIVAGDFHRFNGARANRVVAVNSDGTVDPTLNVNLGPNDQVYAVAFYPGAPSRIILGGDFTQVNGTSRAYLAAVDEGGNLNPLWGGAGPDAPVRALVVDSTGQLVVGGLFTNVNGVASPGLVRLDTSGNVDATFNVGTGFNGPVYALAVLPAGGPAGRPAEIIVGGDFTSYNGISAPTFNGSYFQGGANRYVRLNTNGTQDLNWPYVAFDGPVYSIVSLPSTVTFVGGAFTNVHRDTNAAATIRSPGLINLDTLGFIVSGGGGFVSPVLGGPNPVVRSLTALSATNVLAAGDFLSVNGLPGDFVSVLPRGNVAVFHESGTFAPLPFSLGGADALVTASAYSPLYQPAPIVTAAQAVPGQATSHTNVIETGYSSGSLVFFDLSFRKPESVRVYYGGQQIYSAVIQYPGAPTYLTVPYSVPSFGPGLSTTLTVIINEGVTGPTFDGWRYSAIVYPGPVSSNVVAVGGTFQKFNHHPYQGFTLTDGLGIDTGAPPAAATTAVKALGIYSDPTVPGRLDQIVVGGQFAGLNGVRSYNLLRFNPDGTVDLSFANFMLDGPVNAIAMGSGGSVYVAGDFLGTRDPSVYHFGRIRHIGQDGTDLAVYNIGFGPDAAVNALALQPDGRLIVGGAFQTLDTVVRPFIGRLNPLGEVDLSFNPGSGPNGTVRAVALQPDGKVVIGGDFTTVNGTNRNYIARLNANGSLDTTFNPGGGFDAQVNALALDALGRIVVGGSFQQFNGRSQAWLTRMDASGALDATFNPGSGPNDYVATITVTGDGHIIVGGGFTAYNGIPAGSAVRLNANGSLDGTINLGTGAEAPVLASLEQSFDRRVVLGGAFQSFNGVAADRVVRINGSGNPGSGVLAFSAPAYTVAESGGAVTVTVNRLGGLSGVLTGVFTNLGGTAVLRTNYTLPTTRLTFVDGQYSTNLVLTIVDDLLDNLDRLATLGVISAGVTNTAQLTIVDNESVPNFVLASYNVLENAGVAVISVARLGGAADAYSVQYATSNGTAMAGVDFTSTNGVLNWADGDAGAKTFTVGIIDNQVINSVRALNLALFGATNQTLGTAAPMSGQTNATLVILDNESGPGFLGFTAAAYTVGESGTNVTITVTRTNGILGAVSVNFATLNGTAFAGTNYTNTAGTLRWANGDGTPRTIVVGIVNDFAPNADRTVLLQLSGLTGGARGVLTNAVLTIVDDDSIISLSAPAYSVDEAAGVLPVTVLRTGATNTTVSALLLTSDGSALAGTNYLAVSNVVVFLPGITSLTVPIPILDNTNIAANPTFNLALSAPVSTPAGTSVLGESNAVVTIIENDAGLRFSAAGYNVREDAGRFAITVLRTGRLDSTVAIDYASSNLTAVAGLHYVPVSGTLVFAPGVTTRTFDVPLLDNSITNADRTVLLSLRNPVGPLGTMLIAPVTATLTILDNEALGAVAGSVDPTFNYGLGANGPVNALTFATNGLLVVAGDFSTLNGARVNRVGRLNVNGTVDASFNPGLGPNGVVFGVAVQELRTNAVIVGGAFSSVNGTNAPFLARLRGDGSLDTTFATNSAPDNTVFAVAVQPDGAVVFGGAFTTVGGTNLARIARVDVDGALDATFNPGTGANGIIRAIAVQPDGRILIGGDFTSYNGTNINRIARLNADGSLDNTFLPGFGADGSVQSLVVTTNGTIVVGGAFVTFNGFTRNGITQLNPDGSLDAGFNAGVGANGPVNAIGLRSDGKLVVVGDFTGFNDLPLVRVARLNEDGSVDDTFEPGSGPDNAVNAVAQFTQTAPPVIPISAAGGGIGSNTNVVNTGSTSGVLTLNLNTLVIADNLRVYYEGLLLLDTNVVGRLQFTIPYGPGTSTVVTIIMNEGNPRGSIWNYTGALAPGAAGANVDRSVIGGLFRNYNGEPHDRLALLTGTGVADPAYGVGQGAGLITSVAINTNAAQPDLLGKLVIGGAFNFHNGVALPHLARLNQDGTVDLNFNTGAGLNAGVNAVAVQGDGRVVAGGYFSFANGVSRNAIARFNADGSLDTAFDPGVGANKTVFAVTLQADGKALIGGLFTVVNTTARNYIARLNLDGTVDATFNPGTGANDSVRAIAVQPDGRIIIAGEFTSVAGTTRNRLARLNANGTLDASFNPAGLLDGAVHAVLIDATGGIVVGGSFTSAGGSSRSYLARFTASGVLDAAFNAAGGPDDFVSTLSRQADGRLIVGGGFTSVSGLTRQHLARLNADGSVDATINFGTGANDAVLASLVQFYDGRVVVGGAFTAFEGVPVPHLVRLNGGNNSGAGTLTFELSAYSVSESAGTNAVLTVLRAGGLNGTLTGQLSVTGGTAVNGTDYVFSSPRTLNFVSGQSVLNIPVPILDTPGVNADRTINFAVTAAGQTSTTTLTIRDNDTELAFSLASYSVVENAGTALITVVRRGGTANAYSVQYGTVDATAVAGVDYTNTTGVLNWADGDATAKTFTVTIINNAATNSARSLNLVLFGATNQTLGTAAVLSGQTNATLAIVDDEFGPGEFRFSAATYAVLENAGFFTVPVVRTNGSAGAVAVRYATANGTALAGTNYLATSGILIFAAGETVKTFNIPLLNDTVANGNRTVALSLNSPLGGARIIQTNAVLTILDDDLPGGAVDLTFASGSGFDGAVLALAQPRDGGLLVAGDFTSYNGTTNVIRLARLTTDGLLNTNFNAGTNLNAAVTALALRPDGRLVAGGQFTNFLAINAAGPVSYLAGLDTNGAADAAFNVGTGPNNVVFALALQPDGKLLVGGQFTAINGTNRTFLARLLPDGGVDPSFNPSLAPNQPVRALAVDALGRIVLGGDFRLINGLKHDYLARVDTNGVLDAGFNTDANGPVYALTVQPDGKILVGGDFAAINFTPMGSLARLNPDGRLDGTFTPGTGANDFISLIVLQADGRILVGGGFNLFNGAGQNFVARLTPGGVLDPTINFGTGADNFVAAAAVQPDGKIVLGGGFTVFNGVPQNRITRVSGRSNLDAGLVVYSATNYFVAENTRAVDITLLRLGGLNGALTVTNVSAAGGLNPARPGVDFVTATNVFTFAAGQATTNFAIAIFDTSGTNADRTVALGLSGAVGATASAQVTIVDNDAFPSFSATNGLVTSFSVAENAGQAVITVLRVGGAANAISVGYSATNGTALDGVDFFQTNGVLTWADGDASPKTFLVTVRDNALLDGARTVSLSLFNPSNSTMQTTIPGFLQSTAVLTIFDNEALPGQLTWSTNLYLVNENAGFVDLPIQRVGGSAGIVSVNVSTADDTALFGNDYTRFNAVVVFADGETNKVVRIGIVADAIPEGDEQFRVLLSNPAGGAALGAVANAVVVIADNVVSFASAAYTANEAGGQASIRLIRPVSSLGAVTVDVATVVLGAGPGFAAPGLDYLAVTGTVTFANGETTQDFVVPLVDDQVFRGTRTLGLQLLNPGQGATIGIGAAVLTITDNDVPTMLYSFTNAARISIFNTPDLGAATNQARSPYPSVIPVAGVTGQVVRVAVTLRDFMTTNRPANVDVLLQGPGGQSVVLMAGAGTNIPVASATLGFDDAALDFLPASTALTNGVYRPTLLPGGTVLFPAPAPVSPQGNTFLGVFNNVAPNGDWKLFVKSRGGSLEAFVLAGWQLDFTTVVPAKTNNLSLTMFDTVDPVAVDGVVTYLISVENLGPNVANNVTVFDTLPAQLDFLSGIASQGRISDSNGLVIVNFGSIPNGSVATVLLAARAVVPGVFTNYATVVGGDAEASAADNSAFEVTTVVPGAVSSGGTIPLGITPMLDATLLASTLTGGNSAGLTVQSATLQGHTNAASGATSSGLFNFGPPPTLFGLPAPGIVLSTGNVLDYGVGTNNSPTNTTDFGVAATAAQQLLLNPITRPNTHFDVTQLDIRFAVQPGFNQVTFNLVFGSEEWPAFVGSFNDGFGIFLNGTNIAFTAGRAVNIDHPNMVSNTHPNELNGILAPGNNPVLSFTAPVVPGSTNNVLTFIIGDTLDGLLDSTVYVSSLRALQAPNADLSVSVSAVPAPVFVGSNLSYSITVNNLGPNVAPNAVLRDVLPPEFHLLSATTSQGILSVSNSTLICALGNLGPNGFALINVVGTVVAEGLLTNVASVGSDLPDFANANNTAVDVITAFPFSGYNPTPVSIADAGPALLYPSVVHISGFGGLVDKVTVTLTNLNHANVADIDLLLVGPQGQKVLLMSDVGLLGSVTNADLTFDDDATNSLPQTGSVVSGRYRPTNFGTGDTFYPPAPTGPYATTLAAFTGTDPNGDWKLFLVDDSGRDLGELTGGWRLTFVSPPPPPPVPALQQPRRVGNSLVFAWPLGAFGYVLESTTMMGPGAVWVPEGQVPTTDGINNQVTVPIGNGLKFFRLRKP